MRDLRGRVRTCARAGALSVRILGDLVDVHRALVAEARAACAATTGHGEPPRLADQRQFDLQHGLRVSLAKLFLVVAVGDGPDPQCAP